MVYTEIIVCDITWYIPKVLCTDYVIYYVTGPCDMTVAYHMVYTILYHMIQVHFLTCDITWYIPIPLIYKILVQLPSDSCSAHGRLLSNSACGPLTFIPRAVPVRCSPERPIETGPGDVRGFKLQFQFHSIFWSLCFLFVLHMLDVQRRQHSMILSGGICKLYRVH